MRLASTLIATCWLGTGLAPAGNVVLDGPTMGTRWKVTIPDLSGSAAASIHSEVTAELERIENVFSLFREDSELSRWNRETSTDWQTVSSDLATVAQAALELARKTGGAFDPTIEPLVQVWRLREVARDFRPPGIDELAKARSHVGWEKVEVTTDPPRFRKREAAVRCDLNALVEGHAIDRLASRLEKRGVRTALIELGGEFRGLSGSDNPHPWRIGIEDPRPPYAIRLWTVLTDRAVSTSGVYRQSHTLADGRRVSHILDARTGQPISHETLSVSVIADTARMADGWSTALLVLGHEEGRTLADREGLTACFMDARDGRPTTTRTGSEVFQVLEEQDDRRGQRSGDWGALTLWGLVGLAVCARACRRLRG